MRRSNRPHLARKGDIVKVETEGLYKTIATFLAGVVLSGCVSWFLGPKNAVTQQELIGMMPGLISQYSPYTQDAKTLTDQLTNVRAEQAKEGAQIEQMQIDLARVSEKLGVTAHPGAETR